MDYLVECLRHLKRMKFLLLTILLFGSSVAYGSTMPCSCSTEMRPLGEAVKASKDTAKAVFVGKVVRVMEPKNEDGSPRGVLLAEFEVVKSWKGVDEKFVIVGTGNVCCTCGYPFTLGRTYIVYAVGDDELFTFMCMRTRYLIDGSTSDDEQFLGQRLKIKDTKQDLQTVPTSN